MIPGTDRVSRLEFESTGFGSVRALLIAALSQPAGLIEHLIGNGEGILLRPRQFLIIVSKCRIDFKANRRRRGGKPQDSSMGACLQRVQQSMGRSYQYLEPYFLASGLKYLSFRWYGHSGCTACSRGP